MEMFKKYLKDNTTINDEQLAQLLGELRIKQVSKGETLLIAGSRSKFIYFVCTGLLRSYTLDQQGKEHIIQFAPEKSMIGDRNSVCFDEPAQFYVDAIEDSEVVIINKSFMDLAPEICEDFAIYNTLRLNDTVRVMQQRIGLLLAATAAERYLSFLALYPGMSLRLSQAMIASYLGLTPESLSRVRRRLVKK
jgi:CRP-like cAMP-binding protein